MAFLTGDELLAKVQQLGNASKTELVRACGYYSTNEDGRDILDFTSFYEALLRAEGVSIDPDTTSGFLKNRAKQPYGACQFVLDGFCNGAFPTDGFESIYKEDWYAELINLIKAGQHEKALALAESRFSSEYVVESLDLFQEHEIRFVRTLSISLSDPFVEEANGQDVALFRWIGAQFLMEGPIRLVQSWTQTLQDGTIAFCQEKFDEWIGDDSHLQDGCSYSLGGCLYDLEGFGENGCTIDGDSVVHGLSHISPISETGSFPSTSSESTSICVGGNHALLLPKKYVELVGLKSGDKAFISVQGKSFFVAPDSNENQISEISVLPSGNISISIDILEAIAKAVEPGDEFFLGLGPDKTSLTITPV